MTFFEKITGYDMTKKHRQLEQRLDLLPNDYQKAGRKIYGKLVLHSDFSGRNIIELSEGVLELLEEMNSQGKSIDEVFGGQLDLFCNELTVDEPSFDIRDKWRKKLNSKIQKRFN